MPYIIPLRQFYKIWFSKNSNQFLGYENQLRLIQFRCRHPDFQISIIYSSHCLCLEAKKELAHFCKKYAIKAIDFDSDFKMSITSYQDRVLYDIAKLEIDNTLSNQGGNLAAASDIVRLLTPAIELGIYTDFDVIVDFKFFDKEIQAEAPLLLPVKGQLTQEQEGGEIIETFQWQVNNQMIAVARNTNNEIHDHAHEQLVKFKNAIINNYSNLEPLIKTLSKQSIYMVFLFHFYATHPKADIFNLRYYIDNLTISDYFATLSPWQSQTILKQDYFKELCDEVLYEALGAYIRTLRPCGNVSNLELSKAHLKLLKHRIYLQTVLQMSGPSIFHSLVEETASSRENLRQLTRYGLATSALKNGILSTPFQIIPPVSSPEGLTISLTSDLSWTKEGAQEQSRRENKIVNATYTIQRYWKQYRQRVSICSNAPLKKPRLN